VRSAVTRHGRPGLGNTERLRQAIHPLRVTHFEAGTWITRAVHIVIAIFAIANVSADPNFNVRSNGAGTF
jgi:hypothetical protein